VSGPTGDVPATLEWCVKNAVWWIATGEPLAAAVFALDVVGTSPIMEAKGRDELLCKLGDRRGGLTNVEVEIERVEGDEREVAVTWHMAGDHTGPMLVNEDVLYEPTGQRLRLAIVSTFTLREGAIASFHNEFDLDDLGRQLGRPVARVRPAQDY
jgi:ketosteroid isomerase-like protein